MKEDNPFHELEKLRVWKLFNQGVKDLEANGDIEEKTARKYIVGYLSKILVDSGLIEDATASSKIESRL